MLIVTISRTSRHFSLVDARSRSQLHMAGAFITFSDCLVYVYFSLNLFVGCTCGDIPIVLECLDIIVNKRKRQVYICRAPGNQILSN